jgi:hypothetical protein
LGGFLLVIWKDDQFTKHLPRYCRDLKQILDDKAEALAMRIAYESGNHTVWTNERCLADLKSHRDYPKNK